MSKLARNERGFTIIEIVLACVIFPIVVAGVSNAQGVIRKQYMIARQLNEIYTVLSACPELDRAIDYTSLSSTTNCYPNNNFQSEGGTGNTITYAPTLTVTDSTALPAADPLSVVPDSKVVSISVGYPKNSSPPLKLRLLITRNGIGQL